METPGKIRYFENDRFVGEELVYLAGCPGHSGYWPHRAYFCPQCGSLWARAVVEPEFPYAPLPSDSWVIDLRRCPGCGDGTLLRPQDSLDFCSPELLRREFDLLLLKGIAP